MHLESRCYSSSAINKQTDTTQESIGQAAANTANINRTWLRSQKKDRIASGAGIFSFLQKFRVVNSKSEDNAVTDSRFSLGSPQSSRYSLASVGGGAGRRWESIESVISSATATSFAFIPPHQLRQLNYPRPPPRTNGVLERDQHNIRVSNAGEDVNRLLHNRRRLIVDEKQTTAAPIDPKDIAQIKRLNRNSTGNIENLWIPNNAQWIDVTAAAQGKNTLIIPHKRRRSYRPGKRRAPQPPNAPICFNSDNINDIKCKSTKTENRSGAGVHYEEDDDDEDESYENDENRNINNVTIRKPSISYRKKKKRRAPLPPKMMNDERNKADQTAKLTSEPQQTNDDLFEPEPNDDEPFTYCNDSLKLEKGILKANKHNVDVTTKSDKVKLASPTGVQTAAVSPKPWYKRSCIKVNTHNNLSSFREKRNSCRKDEMDQWMLESGIARFKRTDDDIFKRHSHISVLANISELDRQACEILEKQRKQQRDAINSAEAKFYTDLMNNDHTAGKDRFIFNENVSYNTKKNKDLISMLNNLTSVTKMTVHSAFVSKTASASRERNDNEDAILVSGSSTSVNNMAERSKPTSPSYNLVGNKNKKTSKISEIFDINHRNLRKKDDKKFPNKFSLSFDNSNDMKSPTKEKIDLSTTTTTKLIPIKPYTECDGENSNKNMDQHEPQQTRPVQKPFSSWSCPQCSSENPSWKFICEKCKKWRPYSVSSRTTDQRYFVNLEKDNLVKSKSSYVAEQQEQLIQIMHLNVKNSVASEQTKFNNPKSSHMKSNENSNNNQRDVQRREFYSSIAVASVDKSAEKETMGTSSGSTKTSTINNLNGIQQTKLQSNQPLQYYNEEDRKMLCDILKELKHSISSSESGRTAIGTDALIEQKIINEVDSVISKPFVNPVESMIIASTSTINHLAPTKPSSQTSHNGNKSAAGMKYTVDLKSNSNGIDSETHSVNTGTEQVGRHAKYEENDPISSEKNTTQLPQNEQKQINETKLPTVENKNVPVLAINRLLKKLQTAIANGQHHEAANIARELARLKVSCHMTRRSTFNCANSSNLELGNSSVSTTNSYDTIVVSVYIKEQNHCRGPIPLQIHNITTLGQLKMKLSEEFKIPLQRQQWRSGKFILSDENAILHDLGIDKSGIPLYVNLIDNEEVTDGVPNKVAGPSNLDKNYIANVNNNVSTSSTTQNDTYEGQSNQDPASHWQPDPETSDNIQNDPEHQNDDTNDENETNGNEDNANDLEHDAHSQKIIPVPTNPGNGRELSPEQIFTEIDHKTTVAVSLPTSGWRCTLCTLINETHMKFCAACGEQYADVDENTNTPDVNNSTSTSQQNYNRVPWRIVRRDETANFQNDNHKSRNNAAKKLYYQELIDLEKTDLITNSESFECSVCLLECEENKGVVLRDCLHTFCKDCLQQTVQFSTEAQVKCPFRNASYSCDSVLQEREIKALVDIQTYEKHLARSLSEAQNNIKNAFHCKTPNCTGWCIYEDNVNEFHCPVCRKTNCLTCQVIHSGLNCKQYQEMTKQESENNADTSKTRNMLEEMVEKGEAMVCPTCDIILMKKWGCDWLRCSMCKTEICWVTRGPRWGPAGKGDTSAGCRCGVNGVKCHPRCNYCH